jgi:hypothetical protein
MDKIGKGAFILGLVLAFLASLLPEQMWTLWVLAVLGLVVGLLNVASKESQSFLLAAIGLVLCARSLETIPYVGEFATGIIANVVAFVASAVLVVAVKTVVETAKD